VFSAKATTRLTPIVASVEAIDDETSVLYGEVLKTSG
jgi:hypothetical protein